MEAVPDAVSVELDLERVRRPKGKPVLRRRRDRLDHCLVAVAQNRRPPGADVVDVAPTIYVPDVRSLTALEQQRRPRDGPEGPNRAVHAAREESLGPSDKRRHPGGGARPGRHEAPSSDRISSSGRWIPSRMGVSLTVERRLSVLRSARTRSPKATRSSVS